MYIEINPQTEPIEIGEQESVEIEAPKTEVNISENPMTEIDVSTDIENPTDISAYFDKSGTYVAKNTGIIVFLGEIITPIAKGGFFTVQNFKYDASTIGIEIPDEENILIVTLTIYVSPDMAEEVQLKKIGTSDWTAGIKLTSENVNDYISIDTNNLISKDMINLNYGIKLYNNCLAIQQASNAEIDAGSNTYKAITPNNIGYAVQKKGSSYFAGKTDFDNLKKEVETLNTDTQTLISEIETILESVVTVNE